MISDKRIVEMGDWAVAQTVWGKMLRELLDEREEFLKEHAAWEAMRNGTIDTVRRLDTGGYRAVLGRRHDRVNRRCAYDHYGDPVQAVLAAVKAAKEATQKQETQK